MRCEVWVSGDAIGENSLGFQCANTQDLIDTFMNEIWLIMVKF